MHDVYFAHRAEIGQCAMHDVVCTMYDVQSEINFVTQLVIRQISIVRMAHAERNPRLFCRVLDRCDRSNFLFLIVLMVRFMRDYAKFLNYAALCDFGSIMWDHMIA